MLLNKGHILSCWVWCLCVQSMCVKWLVRILIQMSCCKWLWCGVSTSVCRRNLTARNHDVTLIWFMSVIGHNPRVVSTTFHCSEEEVTMERQPSNTAQTCADHNGKRRWGGRLVQTDIYCKGTRFTTQSAVRKKTCKFHISCSKTINYQLRLRLTQIAKFPTYVVLGADLTHGGATLNDDLLLLTWNNCSVHCGCTVFAELYM